MVLVHSHVWGSEPPSILRSWFPRSIRFFSSTTFRVAPVEKSGPLKVYRQGWEPCRHAHGATTKSLSFSWGARSWYWRLERSWVVSAVIPMLRGNTSLKSLRLMSVKIPIEITCQLLTAMGNHAALKRITLKNSKLGCVMEAELRRFERAILEMAAAPTQLNALILE